MEIYESSTIYACINGKCFRRQYILFLISRVKIDENVEICWSSFSNRWQTNVCRIFKLFQDFLFQKFFSRKYLLLVITCCILAVITSITSITFHNQTSQHFQNANLFIFLYESDLTDGSSLTIDKLDQLENSVNYSFKQKEKFWKIIFSSNTNGKHNIWVFSVHNLFNHRWKISIDNVVKPNLSNH